MRQSKSDPFHEYQHYKNIKGNLKASRMLVDRIMPILPGNAQLILFRIYRQTIGYKNSDKAPEDKVWDTISHGQFQGWCRIKSRNTVKSCVRLLKELNLIAIEEAENNQPDSYMIVLDEFDRYDDLEYEHPHYQELVLTIKI